MVYCTICSNSRHTHKWHIAKVGPNCVKLAVCIPERIHFTFVGSPAMFTKNYIITTTSSDAVSDFTKQLSYLMNRCCQICCRFSSHFFTQDTEFQGGGVSYGIMVSKYEFVETNILSLLFNPVSEQLDRSTINTALMFSVSCNASHPVPSIMVSGLVKINTAALHRCAVAVER